MFWTLVCHSLLTLPGSLDATLEPSQGANNSKRIFASQHKKGNSRCRQPNGRGRKLEKGLADRVMQARPFKSLPVLVVTTTSLGQSTTPLASEWRIDYAERAHPRKMTNKPRRPKRSKQKRKIEKGTVIPHILTGEPVKNKEEQE
ncbi:hypothetical protein BDY21DRAFT_48363 [Lineolata rhizophorae]|uniref:Secreted protein n=1 Tax=Lineolata rhizophorae TaxID=578093 RepID=A0A6A6NYJ3_9PEZI|nr:hypothetical protein BDY21DRAFT_48363 [Lineolata rhizophorae]